MINSHHFAERLIPDLAVNLAYAIGNFDKLPISDLTLELAYALGNTFGEQFDSWQDTHQKASTNAKVEFFQIFELSVKDFFQVRHFVRTWESHFGESATPQAMIEALQKAKPKSQDIIDQINSKYCL